MTAVAFIVSPGGLEKRLGRTFEESWFGCVHRRREPGEEIAFEAWFNPLLRIGILMGRDGLCLRSVGLTLGLNIIPLSVIIGEF
jgi:hypothetical protein